MNDDFEDLRKIFALKRYEQPPPGLVDDVVQEFQRRRDVAMQTKSAFTVFKQRVADFFESWTAPDWGLAGAAAVAVVAGVMWLIPDRPLPVGPSSERISPVGADNRFEGRPFILAVPDEADEPTSDSNGEKSAAEKEKEAKLKKEAAQSGVAPKQVSKP